MDVTGMGDPDAIASAIREEIFAATKCTASAGVGGNMLLARLATKKAKPNGMYHIMPDEVHVLRRTTLVLITFGILLLPILLLSDQVHQTYYR